MPSQAGRIVVAYDGSEPSAAALDWAATEAERRQRPLTVMHVVDYWSLVPGPVVLAPWPDRASIGGDTLADEGVARASILADTVEVTSLTRTGQVAHTLVRASRDADLLVVGTRGHGDLTGAVLGSVAFAVSAHAHCPVVVVRGDSSQPPGPDRPVVVGIDNSPGAGAALRFAADIAAGARAPLIVTTIYRPLPRQNVAQPVHSGYHPDDGDGARVDSETRAVAEKVAEAAAHTANDLRPELTVHQRVLIGSTVGQLSTAAHRAGLLVVGSRGRGGFAGLVLGSVSHGVIHSSPCPVAVVRGQSSTNGPPGSRVPATRQLVEQDMGDM